jgi:hypothetical protein
MYCVAVPIYLKNDRGSHTNRLLTLKTTGILSSESSLFFVARCFIRTWSELVFPKMGRFKEDHIMCFCLHLLEIMKQWIGLYKGNLQETIDFPIYLGMGFKAIHWNIHKLCVSRKTSESGGLAGRVDDENPRKWGASSRMGNAGLTQWSRRKLVNSWLLPDFSW